MGTTTNYGWPTPVSTDYVTDGWDAIKDLGDAIDTTVALIRVPTGCVLPYAADGANAPSGFLYARGQTVSRTTYAALFAVLGTTYGAGDGTTTFGLPNLQTRVPAGLDKNATPDTAFDVLGETGGTKNGLEAHTHGVGTYAASTSATTTASTAGAGSHSHAISGQGNYDVHGHDISLLGTTSTSHTHTGSATAARGVAGGTTATMETWVPSNVLSLSNDTAAAHTHTVTATTTATTTLSGSSASNGTTDANLPPYIVLNYIIKT